MKKFLIVLSISAMALVDSIGASTIEQTICFSKGDCHERISYATVGEGVKLCGGACQSRTLVEMNKEGWALIQVIGGLSGSFGMVLERRTENK